MIRLHKTYAGIVFALFALAYFIILANLYCIQIKDAVFFSSLGSQQYFMHLTSMPPRAPILDRTGKQYLALNTECLSAFITPCNLKNPDTLYAFLAQHFPHAYERLQSKPDRQFMYIKRRLSPEHQGLLSLQAHPDIHLLREASRFYPIAAATPVVGLTGLDNEGLCGIEYQCNDLLMGTPTLYCLEKDARSGCFYFQKHMQSQGQEGQPIQLTIDADLQFLVDECVRKTVETFGAQEGAALIIDPDHGDILALVSYPHFDPQSGDLQDLSLVKNRPISDSYELGSVFKVFAAMAALEEGVVTPDELIDCRNTKSTVIDGRTINTVHSLGIAPFTTVVANSNNIGIAIVAQRLSEHLYEHYVRLGFGKKTGIDLPGEHKGFVNSPASWSKQSIISLSYGYEVSATLLQLGCAFCTIANGGYAVRPRIMMHERNAGKHGNQLYSDATLTTIKEILTQTAQRGTARKAAIHGYKVMSKTGTANMLINGAYDSTKNMYTCAGIIEKDTYHRVVVTFVKQADRAGLFASGVSAPLFRDIAEQLIIHERAM